MDGRLQAAGKEMTKDIEVDVEKESQIRVKRK
jgi:hypothetical protein